ncbi:MAG TPA: substrate-binding domain-containing protein [Thermoplasmata archaeon]|nr:substrate-binding domain-containing protein [Thermoplasmata archaeon]
MSERSVKKIIRHRHARRRKAERAVSPVVATLILILVAVAAAAALYLWLVAWQGGVTNSIGSPSAQSTLSIGGSTSVYPFTEVARIQFQQNNSGIVFADNQGGTTAGMIAVCHGAIDIGASSSLQTPAALETSFGCPVTTTVTTVAYDAVDIVVASANTHGLNSMSWDTLAAIYDGTSTSATLLAPSIDGVAYAAPINVAPWSTHAALAWDQIPACVIGAATCGGAGNPAEAAVATIGAGIACTTGVDICANAGVSPCGFAVCAGPFTGTTGTDLIKTVDRTDGSGTTQTFEARLLGATSASAFAASTASLGFGGCGSNNVISDCGMAASLGGNGNPGVISTVAGGSDNLGYASDGLARASTSGVGIVAFLGVGQTAVTGSDTSNGGVVANPGAGHSISNGIKGTGTAQYVGWRPFEYVTQNTPTGEAQRFIQFVLAPGNNIALAAESAEVSVYSV